MSTTRLQCLAAAAALVLACGSALASPIVGSIMFSDRFASNGSWGADSLYMNVGSSTLAQACTGVFAVAGACVPSGGTSASVVQGSNGMEMIFSYDGFTFTVTDLTRSINVSGASLLSYTGTGTVTKPGFDSGTFSIAFTSNGSSWFANVAAVPEPGTLALLGVAILILGFVRRPKFA